MADTPIGNGNTPEGIAALLERVDHYEEARGTGRPVARYPVYVNPDGPEAAITIRELVASKETSLAAVAWQVEALERERDELRELLGWLHTLWTGGSVLVADEGPDSVKAKLNRIDAALAPSVKRDSGDGE